MTWSWPSEALAQAYGNTAHGWEDTGQKVIESEMPVKKTFEITADMLASCTYKLEASSELEAKRLFEEGSAKFLRRRKVKWVTSPIVTDIKEIDNGNA